MGSQQRSYKKLLTAEQKYDLWVRMLCGQITQAEAVVLCIWLRATDLEFLSLRVNVGWGVFGGTHFSAAPHNSSSTTWLSTRSSPTTDRTSVSTPSSNSSLSEPSSITAPNRTGPNQRQSRMVQPHPHRRIPLQLQIPIRNRPPYPSRTLDPRL